MNPQAMMKQVQKIQKEMMKTQEEINNSEFEGKNSLVTLILDGQKKLKKIKLNLDSFDEEDIEMLEDMIVVAHNEAIEKIDKVTEEKMGAYTKGLPNIPGLF